MQRKIALDVLLDLNDGKGDEYSGKGNTVIGSQMLYETYLEDHLFQKDNSSTLSHPSDSEEDDDDDDEEKKRLINSLYQNDRHTFTKTLLQSDTVYKPLMHYAYGGFNYPAADYVFVYDEDDENVLSERKEESIRDYDDKLKQSANCPFSNKTPTIITPKEETKIAYNNVGTTASRKGNTARARAIMTQLGYTEDDMDIIGEDDIYNFQGVANPHKVANIQYEER
eukprot:8167116-Ditylum_brightwellii.AAC.1